tara:strand:- start:365 stop:550 length:186 start_codon:yes stop_codon:yes gene_type:complete
MIPNSRKKKYNDIILKKTDVIKDLRIKFSPFTAWSNCVKGKEPKEKISDRNKTSIIGTLGK